MAVDPGSVLGCCVLRGTTIRYLGAVDLDDRHPLLRLQELWKWLQTLHAWGPEFMVIEGYSFARSGKGTFTLGEFGGVIRLFAGAAQLPFLVIPPTSLKKFVVGRGGKTKTQGPVEKVEMGVQVLKRWGVECKTGDEADAYGLARLALNILSPGFDELTQPQADVVKTYAKEIERGHIGFRSDLRTVLRIGAQKAAQ